MKRLFTINGVTQLVNILIQIETSKSKSNSYQDYLAIYSLVDTKQKNPYLYEVISKIISIHNWEKIVFFDGQIDSIKEIYSNLDVTKFDIEELYLVRNWTNNNEMFQEAFSEAKVIIYGDSLGIFDSIISSNYKIDKINLILPTLPINESVNEETIDKIEIISKSNVYKVLRKLSRLFTYKNNDKVTLFICSYFSRNYFMSLTQEIDLYFELIKLNHEKENLLILKPHPRDDGQIINKLYDKLISEGYLVEIIEDSLRAVPIEILIFVLNTEKIVGTISTGLASIKFLKPDIKLVYDDLSDVQNLKLTQELSNAFAMNKELIEKANFDNSKIIYLNSEIGGMKYFYSKYKEVEDLLEFCLFNQHTNKEIVVFGAGGRYTEYSNFIREKGIKIRFIIDSNSTREGEEFDDKKIISKHTFQQLNKKNNKKYFIIIISSFAKDIAWFLNSLGYKKYIDFIEL